MSSTFGLGLLLLCVPVAAVAQDRDDQKPQGSEMASGMRMIMPTDDFKAFRLVRPLVAAMQVKLAELAMFDGRINGLYGPSTRDAVSAYQTSLRHEATGLATLRDALALMGIDGGTAVTSYRARIDVESEMPMGVMEHAQMPMGEMEAAQKPMGEMEHPPEPMAEMDHAQMAMPMMGRDAPSDDGSVSGDPGTPKSLMAMDMPGMVMDNRHTRAVRAVREIVAAMQISLAELDSYEGTIHGFPEGEGMTQALRTFQTQAGLDASGSLDFATSLALFDLDPARVATKYAGRLAIAGSPVVMDHELMDVSADRFATEGDAVPSASEEPHRSDTGSADTVRIEVTLREFVFEPDTIRLPAGHPVTLVIENTGRVPHEFMAGREVRDDGFEHDLFAGLEVNMVSGTNAAEGGDHEHADAGAGHGGEEGDGEDGHGTMAQPEVGETIYMSFFLPESRRGMWNIGCFLPGHYQAGMHGILIVE